MNDPEPRYCESCFIRWPEGQDVCWQCGEFFSVTKAEADRILAEAARLDTMMKWAARLREW